MSKEPCRADHPHEPHVYISAIAGGPTTGALPQIACMCPGRKS